MRLGIKGKQVLGVTSIVGAVVVVLSLLHLATLAARRASRKAGRAPSCWPTRSFTARAQVVIAGARSVRGAARRSRACGRFSSRACTPRTSRSRRLSTSTASPSPTPTRRTKGQPLPPAATSTSVLVAAGRCRSCARIYTGQGRNLEFRQPLLLGDTEFGSIRIGVSTLLIRQDLDASLRPAVVTALVALGVAVLVGRCCSRSCCCGRFT